MRDPWEEAGLATAFATHARTALPRAPLNSALAGIISRERAISSLLGHAPPSQQQPVLLLAAIHFSVLRDRNAPLAAWYPTVTETPRPADDPALAAELRSFVRERTVELIATIAERQVQTNEIGRCALLLPAFGAVFDEIGGPLAHLDVGTSAGLTLLLPQLGYDYDLDGELRHLGRSTLRVTCGVRGRLPVPIPDSIPPIRLSRGVDPRPVRVQDPDDAAWLLACCWPDELVRFDRLRRAIDLAGAQSLEIERGDTADVERLVASVPVDVHPVVTTTWALNYATSDARRTFVADLDRLGEQRDLDWIAAESPAQTPELPHPPALASEHITSVVRVTWRRGRRSVTHLAKAHPHGHWMQPVDPA